MKGYQSKVYRPIRLGKVQIKPAAEGINISLAGKGRTLKVPDFMEFKVEDGYLCFKSKKTEIPFGKKEKSLWGTTVSLIRSYIIGLEKNHFKTLYLCGPGYRSAMSGKKITLNVGHSHEDAVDIPEEDIKIVIENTKGNPREEKIAAQKIIVSGADKQKVGDVANRIQSCRPYNVCSGNGIAILGADLSLKRKAGASKK
jgi:large subunit ribosomal protein L6